jgi:hypothetical protein
MIFTSVQHQKQIIVTCIPDGTKLKSEADALDAVTACGEYDTNKILIPGESLSESFYDLKSGLAGAVLLKFSNYRIKAAVIVRPENIGHGKFYEFVLEANRGNDFRVFQDRDKALDWLLNSS